jgi:cyclic beta-1,2-glucan synthetase
MQTSRRQLNYVALSIILSILVSAFIESFLCTSRIISILLMPFILVVSNYFATRIVNLFVIFYIERRYIKYEKDFHMEKLENPVLVVVPTLIFDRRHLDLVVAKFEKNFRKIDTTAVVMVLLVDFVDSATEYLSQQEVDLLEHCSKKIQLLNLAYSTGDCNPPFILASRKRQYSETEQAWIGSGRKLGKIFELFKLTQFIKSEIQIAVGLENSLRGAKYALVVDDDCELTPGSLQFLIASAEHPLNQPVFDHKSTAVTAGHGIIFPTIGRKKNISAAPRSICYDLFGAARFPGKGLYNIHAFLAALEHRIPEESVLSHDTFESLWLRPGLCSFATVIEGHPSSYIGLCERRHRWVRGDWQNFALTTALISKKTHIPFFGWLTIFEQLRNSLLPISTTLILFSLIKMPGFRGVIYLAFGFFAQSILDIAFKFISYRKVRRLSSKKIIEKIVFIVVHNALLIQSSPHRAICDLDAIASSWMRIFTKRKILQWTSAAQIDYSTNLSLRSTRYLFAITLASAIFTICAALEQKLTPLAVILLLSWVLSPLWLLTRTR